jgi:ribosome-associated translation inhibitor RaiA
MNFTEPTTLLSAEGFSARPELTVHAEAKAAKLRRHANPRIGHVRLHVCLETPREGTPRFAVVATAETRGLDFVAHGLAPVPESAISEAFVKLERSVSAAAGVRKHQLHHPRTVEISALLPKAM